MLGVFKVDAVIRHHRWTQKIFVSKVMFSILKVARMFIYLLFFYYNYTIRLSIYITLKSYL